MKHGTEEQALEWLKMPLLMFGGLSAMELLDSKEDDYSADVMGGFRRMFE